MVFQRVKRPQVLAPKPGEPAGDRSKQNLKPTNERLWHLLTMQARAKFVKYPSPTASKWVHQRYLEMGGKFVDTAAEERKRKAVNAAREIAKHTRERKKHKKEK